MSTQDIRWKQRLSSFEVALGQLEQAVKLSQTRGLSDLEKQGIIQAFEFTHELAWNVFRDYLVHQGVTNVVGSRDASREAFTKGLIENGDPWMEMIKSRNQTSHTYNRKTAEEIVSKIQTEYFEQFVLLKNKMNSLK